jgi:Zn-dependent protease
MFPDMEEPVINRETFQQRIKRMFAPILVGLVAAGKLIVAGLPMIKMGGSMLIALGFYAWAFGWWFGVGFILLIFIHEMGHIIAARLVGLKVSVPYFIPFMGAVIMLKEMPRNAWIESIIGIGGPLLGSLGALGAVFCYFLTGHQIFLALGYFGFFLNLFNLVPIVPLDGGRIVSAISPWLWILGLLILIPYLVLRMMSGGLLNSVSSIFILLIVLTSVPRVIRFFRNRTPERMRYFECTPMQRGIMAFLYFGLILSLYLGMGIIRNLMPPGSSF